MSSTPLSAEAVFATRVHFDSLRRHGAGLLWTETRPAEGRTVLVSWSPDHAPVDVTPSGQSCSSHVGYGGTPYAVAPNGQVFACDGATQRIYNLGTGLPITPASENGAVRWADFVIAGDHLYAVRESHQASGRVVNELVRVATDGSGDCIVLDGEHDFVAAPRVSPDESRLSWLTWDHPQMPWDGTDLWVADLTPAGTGAPVHVAGGASEAIVDPTWSPGGDLLFHSDRSGWWNLHRGAPGDALVTMDRDMCPPMWFVGLRTIDVFDDGRIVCTWIEDAVDHLGVLHPDGRLDEVVTPYTRLACPTVVGDHVAVVIGGPLQPAGIALLDPVVGGPGELLRQEESPVPEDISMPVPMTFPTTNGAVAHAHWYPPASAADLAPVIVNCHGGPTSHVTPVLDLSRHYWTSRGYGYLEVNFRGSTGYGRAYRDALKGTWGVVDVDDAVAGALHLVSQGLADGSRLVVRGLSGGGWLTLCALAFRDIFAAGGSSNGVADAAKMAKATHKFESRYLDSLIGPLPEARAIYDARSPINAASKISAPLILIQGAMDEVVPADQAQLIADALRERGVLHEHHVYPNEGHVFVDAANLAHALNAEADFFERALVGTELR